MCEYNGHKLQNVQQQIRVQTRWSFIQILYLNISWILFNFTLTVNLISVRKDVLFDIYCLKKQQPWSEWLRRQFLINPNTFQSNRWFFFTPALVYLMMAWRWLPDMQICSNFFVDKEEVNNQHTIMQFETSAVHINVSVHVTWCWKSTVMYLEVMSVRVQCIGYVLTFAWLSWN